MDRVKLIAQLKPDEGVVNHVYQDKYGWWTIGVGHLVDPRKGGKISNATIDFILGEDIDSKSAELFIDHPWMLQLNDARQNVFVEMAFQMGEQGLDGFHDTLEFARTGNYDASAAEMLKSKWGSVDSPERAARMAAVMRSGVLP